ncbi:BTAD domain-containing putative transcriptional regulator [Saccharomonospora sp. NPDC046836]|uniref:tetratricopeptide repeat protein n=1 Tax=Saccharomonospora sp. NPDC046836 TaxID=3156921 RepID=UPI003405E244
MGTSKAVEGLIRGLRRRAGLTQQEVADLAGMSVAGLRDIEQGRVTRPRTSTLRKLAIALGLSRFETEELIQAGTQRDIDAPGVRLEVLGPLRVVVDGALVDVGSETQRVLLGLLALSPNAPVSKDTFVEVTWGTRPPPTAVDSLQSRMSRLRRRLQPTKGDAKQAPVLTATRGGYQLTLATEQLDLLVFRRLVTHARHARANGDLDHSSVLFGQALALWRGEPLAGLAALHTHPVVAALNRQWSAVVVEYAAVAADLAHHDEVLPLLQRVAEGEPLHEAAHAALMIALAGTGQQAAALATFDSLRRRLSEELGADPGPELTSAHQRVLRQEVPRTRFAPVTAHQQLPPDIADFTGRARELRILSDRLAATEGSTAVAVGTIQGMGGVGKTRLAVHLAHLLVASGHYGDDQLYVDLRGHADQPPADPATVLASFLRMLGVPSEHIPANIEDRAALYRDRLADKRTLVLLDNAASEEQVQPLLPAGSANLVLITSRRALALDGAHTLPLDVFSPTDAYELLAAVIGEERVMADPAAARRVVELCGRLPLAVALAARRLQSRSSWQLADLADRLATAGDRLDELVAGNRQLRAVFDLSYRALHSRERRMFRLLALHPGGDITTDTAATLGGCAPAEARRLLDRLVDEHLVTMDGVTRYRLHDLLGEYARWIAGEAEPAAERRSAVGRLLDYFLHTAARAVNLAHERRWIPKLTGTPPEHGPRFETRHDARSWLETERGNLAAAVTLAARDGWATHAWQLAFTIGRYLNVRGYTYDWAQTYEASLEAVLGASDPIGEAVMRLYLGRAHLNEGRNEEAEDHLRRALQLQQQTRNRMLETDMLTTLGTLYSRTGQYQQALECAVEVRQLCAGFDPAQESIMWTASGTFLARQGRSQEAVDHYGQALALATRLSDGSTDSQLLANTGETYRLLGRYSEAVTHLERALHLAREDEARPVEVYARHRLGCVYRSLGRLDQALAHLEAARRLVETVRAVAITETEVLIDLGIAHRDAGNLDGAAEFLQQAITLATARKERYLEARAHNGLGDVHQRRRETEAAQEQWHRAGDLLRQLGTVEADPALLETSSGTSTQDAGIPAARTGVG